MQTTYRMFIETEVPENELIVSRTDLKGNITYANETFARISGYEIAELIGKPHNIVRHPDMPSSVFKELWQTLKKGEIWRGYVKNLRKDGGYYWVYAEVSGVYKEGQLVEYKSMRSPVEKQLRYTMQETYDKRKQDDEGMARAVVYLCKETLEKIEKLSLSKHVSTDSIIEEILNDALF